MLTIRLTRKGRKNQPFFRVVLVDKRRSAKGGRAVEILGYIDPLTKKKSLEKDRILHWIKMGAKPSDTMHNLLISEKIIEGKKVNVVKIHPVKSVGGGVSPEAGQFNGVKKTNDKSAAVAAAAKTENLAETAKEIKEETKPAENPSTELGTNPSAEAPKTDAVTEKPAETEQK